MSTTASDVVSEKRISSLIGLLKSNASVIGYVDLEKCQTVTGAPYPDIDSADISEIYDWNAFAKLFYIDVYVNRGPKVIVDPLLLDKGYLAILAEPELERLCDYYLGKFGDVNVEDRPENMRLSPEYVEKTNSEYVLRRFVRCIAEDKTMRPMFETCFPGSTYVFINGGRAITISELNERLSKGEKLQIASVNKDGGVEYRAPGGIKVHNDTRSSGIVKIQYEDADGHTHVITTTDNHPIGVGSSGQFVEAGKLAVGMDLYMSGYKTARVTDVFSPSSSEDGPLYDIVAVQPWSTYLVSSTPDIEDAIVAHNKMWI